MTWHILTTEPQSELRAFRWLTYRFVECYLPQVRVVVKSGPRGQKRGVIRPILPGYVFARFNTEADVGEAVRVPGVSRLLEIGGGLATLTQAGIDVLRQIEADMLPSGKRTRKVWPFNVGDMVRLTGDGWVWTGYQGLLQKLDKHDMATLDLVLPTRTVSLKAVPASRLQKVG